MPPLYWGSANSHQSGTDWSQTRARSHLKQLVSLGQSSANYNLRFRRFSPSSRIWIGGLPGCQTSLKIYNPIYLITRISSLLELILRGICSSPAVLWRNSRFKWPPDGPLLSLQNEREGRLPLKTKLSCAIGHEKRLESETTCRGVYFWWGAGVPGGEQATGRCLPEVQHYYVGHISQKEPGPQGPDSSSA